jgi:N-acyl homoserine lactone hydrolase
MSELAVQIFQTGTVGVDKAVPNRGVSKNPLAYIGLLRSPKNHITIPVKCFLIRHPSGQCLLVDTGWDKAVRTHPIQAITFPMWVASKPVLPKGQAIDEQLASVGLTPSDLSGVLMTHMDIDHDSGLTLVKKAPHIYVSPEEIKALHSHQARYVKKPYRGIPLTPIRWTGDYGPFHHSWDIFEDGSVIAFLTPGHSEGSLCIKVQRGSKFLLIVGDSGYNEDSWEHLNLPGPVYSKKDVLTTLSWIARQRKSPDCLTILCAHDPSEKTKPQSFTL